MQGYRPPSKSARRTAVCDASLSAESRKRPGILRQNFGSGGVDFFAGIAYNKIKKTLEIKKGKKTMNLAKISANGQITVPIEIRKLLGLKSGDKILFVQTPGGSVTVSNASREAIYKAQKAFAGVAEEWGVKDEDDVQALVDEVRYGGEK